LRQNPLVLIVRDDEHCIRAAEVIGNVRLSVNYGPRSQEYEALYKAPPRPKPALKRKKK